MTDFTAILAQFIANFILFLPKIITSLLIFLVGLVAAGLLSRGVRRLMQQRQLDPELTLLMGQVTRWGIITLGVTIALQQVNFDLTAFLTGLGILGFTIGFAIQDVSKNFIAGLLLLLQQPFDIGDIIEVAGYAGTVKTVDLRATEIYTLDGKHVLIPNADVFTNAITNLSRTSSRRIELTVGVSYDSDLDEVQQTTLTTLAGIDGVLQEPEPAVVFNNFGGSSIDFTLYYWVDMDSLGLFAGTAVVVKAIKTAFEQADIDIPFPIRVVKMKGDGMSESSTT